VAKLYLATEVNESLIFYLSQVNKSVGKFNVFMGEN